MLPFAYKDLSARLASIRGWAGDVTDGNRCALVLGMTLKLRPGAGDTSFRGLPGAKENIRNQPFLSKMFVKAGDVAFQVTKAYGRPDIISPGSAALEQLKDKHGVVYLKHCWQTPTEKFTFSKTRSGDHIDLWDGAVIEIYRNNPGANTLVRNAEKVLFWKCK